MIKVTHSIIDKLTWLNVGDFRNKRAAKHKIEKLERRDGVCQNRYFISSFAMCVKCKDGILLDSIAREPVK